MSDNQRNTPDNADRRSTPRARGSVKKSPAKKGHLFKRWSEADKNVGQNDARRQNTAAKTSSNERGNSPQP
jgi:hypothetical protein